MVGGTAETVQDPVANPGSYGTNRFCSSKVFWHVFLNSFRALQQCQSDRNNMPDRFWLQSIILPDFVYVLFVVDSWGRTRAPPDPPIYVGGALAPTPPLPPHLKSAPSLLFIWLFNQIPV